MLWENDKHGRVQNVSEKKGGENQDILIKECEEKINNL